MTANAPTSGSKGHGFEAETQPRVADARAAGPRGHTPGPPDLATPGVVGLEGE